jgi:hypothetical protein
VGVARVFGVAVAVGVRVAVAVKVGVDATVDVAVAVGVAPVVGVGVTVAVGVLVGVAVGVGFWACALNGTRRRAAARLPGMLARTIQPFSPAQRNPANAFALIIKSDKPTRKGTTNPNAAKHRTGKSQALVKRLMISALGRSP